MVGLGAFLYVDNIWPVARFFAILQLYNISESHTDCLVLLALRIWERNRLVDHLKH